MANSNGWGDGAANNAIGWGQGANNNIGWGKSHSLSSAGLTDIVGLTTDSDAQAFITAAAITDATQQSAIDTLVKGLKTDGIWTKMKAIYPFVGGTASTHKYNLKDPRDLDAAFRLVFNGGWTHSSTGATPNGTNGYANTYLNQSGNLTPSNNHISLYSRSNNLAYQIDSGVTNNTSFSFSQLLFSTNAIFENGSQVINTSTPNSLGLFLGASTSSTNSKLYKNGTSIASSTTSQARTMFNNNIYLATTNVSTTNLPAGIYSAKQYAFSSIGDGLTDTEASNLYSRVQQFQVSLSRNV